MSDYKQTKLWKEFESKADVDNVVEVESHIKKAISKLKLVRDTFPAYTLHDEEHSLNVLKLMGELLGDSMQYVDSLELVMLILSAYYHDIGMVYSNSEKDAIKDNPLFNDFLKSNPKYKLRIAELQKNKSSLPEDIVQAFCRWNHPQKSYDDIMIQEGMKYGKITINKKLALLCQSHGNSIYEAKNNEALLANFHENTDLLFCAIILRLADIMDFDYSRTPEEIYQYLSLSSETSSSAKISNVEWLKHIDSEGFSFPRNGRKNNYAISFHAQPDKPIIEKGIREFLKIIENEINDCIAALRYCSDRWKNFKLPSSYINKDNICSQGYTYGEYRFTLDHDNVLKLLIGENLYSDDFVFIRELLQNSIDTSRFRESYEKGRGNSDFKCEPINITSWRDATGYVWFRIDDYGMGMSKEIIEKYFLQIGRSYYNSDDFKLDTLTDKNKLVPISRFGIGILSCFIVGDQIELSTRYIKNDVARNAIRMTMEGSSGFFTMMHEYNNLKASSMPAKYGESNDYRKADEYGTSIAVRLKQSFSFDELDFTEEIKNYVSFSPIQIQHNDMSIGCDYDRILYPWIKDYKIDLPNEIVLQLEEVLKMDFEDGIKIGLYTIDITRLSQNPSIKGQVLYIKLEISDRDKKTIGIEYKREVKIIFDNISRTFELDVRFRDDDTLKRIVYIDDRINYLNISIRYGLQKLLGYNKAKVELIHSILDNAFRFKKEDITDLKEVMNANEDLDYLMSEIDALYDQITEYKNLKKLKHKALIHKKISLDHCLCDVENIYPVFSKFHLTYNGINLPQSLFDALELSNTEDGILLGVCALFDELRPEMLISRDRVRFMPIEIYLALHFPLYKALMDIDNCIYSPFYGYYYFSQEGYKKYYQHNLVSFKDTWKAEKIFYTQNGFLSISDIDELICISNEIYLTDSEDVFFGSLHKSIQSFSLVKALLLQTNYSISYINKSIVISRVLENEEKEIFTYFPPVFFIAYQKESRILKANNIPLNINHDLSTWLIGNAPFLFNNYSKVFNFLIEKLMRIDRLESIDIAEINLKLDKLNEINSSEYIKANFKISEADFEFTE